MRCVCTVVCLLLLFDDLLWLVGVLAFDYSLFVKCVCVCIFCALFCMCSFVCGCVFVCLFSCVCFVFVFVVSLCVCC